MARLYIAMFWLPRPQREHAQIVDVIRATSVGNFKQFMIPGGVAFAYESEQPPWQLSFSKILHTGDTKLIAELGDQIVLDGLGAVDGWLNARRPRR